MLKFPPCLTTAEKKSRMRDTISVMKILITTNVDPNLIAQLFIGSEGSTRLHSTTDIKEAKILLRNGADVNKKNKWGETPLHIAVSEGKGYLFTKLLIDHGADVNACSALGRTPLHLALKKGNELNLKIIKLLLNHGAEVDVNDHQFFLSEVSHDLYGHFTWHDKGDKALIKSLIRTTLLHGFTVRYCNKLQAVFCDGTNSYDIGDFVVDCIDEVLELMTDRVCKEYTLYQIITSEPEELKLFPVKLSKNIQTKYPLLYEDIKDGFIRYMRRVVFFKLLRNSEMVMFSESSNKEIFVDSYCLTMICEYLVNNDIGRFLKALYDEETLQHRIRLLRV